MIDIKKKKILSDKRTPLDYCYILTLKLSKVSFVITNPEMNGLEYLLNSFRQERFQKGPNDRKVFPPTVINPREDLVFSAEKREK